MRPDQTRSPPPGPGFQKSVSMPLRTTRAAGTVGRHEPAVNRLTAVNVTGQPSWAVMADSSQGVGGVWSVVTTGTRRAGAIATGR